MQWEITKLILYSCSRKYLTVINSIILSTVTGVSKHNTSSMMYAEHNVRIISCTLIRTLHFRCFFNSRWKRLNYLHNNLLFTPRLPNTFYKYFVWSLLHKPLYKVQRINLNNPGVRYLNLKLVWKVYNISWVFIVWK